jgi:16S rRNA (guanine527-N7)-methyltransferase
VSGTSDAGGTLSALASRYSLAGPAQDKLHALLQLLVHDELAPTAIRDPDAVAKDHLADSLVALELDSVRSSGQTLDIGSGAGLPALPLAIALPEVAFALIESSARKCVFLERAVSVCRLSNVEVVHARAESFGEARGRYDLVMARAVAPLDVTAEYAAPLLRVGGTLVAWRGRRSAEAEVAAARAAAELGMATHEIRPVRPYPGAQHRHLYLMSKVMETPSRYPRRPGVALKRPLGSALARRGASSDRPRR